MGGDVQRKGAREGTQGVGAGRQEGHGCGGVSGPCWGCLRGNLAALVDVGENRGRKGLYAKARAGILKEFTGISDPYEEPTDAGVTVDTGELSPEEAAQEIILHLEREGFIGVNGATG